MYFTLRAEIHDDARQNGHRSDRQNGERHDDARQNGT